MKWSKWIFDTMVRGTIWHTVSAKSLRYLEVTPVETHSVDLSTTWPC